MKDARVVRTVIVDCEQCLKEETVEDTVASQEVPEGWIEIHEGPPFNNSYQFCTPECFLEWHKRDRYERLQEYHDRAREKERARREADGG